jgi:hypothetical protein
MSVNNREVIVWLSAFLVPVLEALVEQSDKHAEQVLQKALFRARQEVESKAAFMSNDDFSTLGEALDNTLRHAANEAGVALPRGLNLTRR